MYWFKGEIRFLCPSCKQTSLETVIASSEDHNPSIPTRRFARSVSGFRSPSRILIVVYTPRRMKNGKEIIRIISARQATRKERKAYAG